MVRPARECTLVATPLEESGETSAVLIMNIMESKPEGTLSLSTPVGSSVGSEVWDV
ncbi:hypothetical protein TESG_06379 [Trichophyton tonsurans CBS 112818]|uniref:Uncharacterized protein n=1 Tax=Trichophyton tonsurans (strain CBS 112818) TaxID=647933 RepID=F2S620_TRIT1|nr:hypothetical protein TESG_06379 [Trichophyton tonsurans CBS 112818]